MPTVEFQNDNNQQSHESGSAFPLMDQVARQAARQRIMEEQPVRILAHGTRMYAVPAGWEKTFLERDPAVSSCLNTREFESALRDPAQTTLFVPMTARLSEATIERICARNGITKTIFKEVN